MTDPTKTTYAELQAAWKHFNRALFNNSLPPCLATLQRKANARGYFAYNRFVHRADGSMTSELSLNPKHFNERTPTEILSTFVHEMVHARQRAFGNPGRGGYHNKQWADWMDEVGLCPSATGEPGGKRVGDRVSHYIVKGGPFDLACTAFLAKHEGLLWGDRPVDKTNGVGGKRSKYICSDCQLAAWAKPGVSLLCAECAPPTIMLEQITRTV